MKTTTITALLLIATVCTNAQKSITKTGKISFFSTTPVENIDATNNKVLSIMDQSTGQLVFSLSIRDFHFKDHLMEDHFNEKYLESDKFPKAQFDGKIDNLSTVDFTKDGEYDVTISGKLTIHGVTNNIVAKGKLVVKGKTIKGTSAFKVKLVDYKIEVPTLVFEKIAQEIDVNVEMNYEPYQQ